MEEIDLEPILVWPFQPDVGVGRKLLEKIARDGWSGIKRVPIFEIPNNIEKNGFSYILMDGRHRREIAKHLGVQLPCALFSFGEKVDLAEHNLDYFRHYDDPNLYDKLVAMFMMR